MQCQVIAIGYDSYFEILLWVADQISGQFLAQPLLTDRLKMEEKQSLRRLWRHRVHACLGVIGTRFAPGILPSTFFLFDIEVRGLVRLKIDFVACCHESRATRLKTVFYLVQFRGSTDAGAGRIRYRSV